MAGTVSAECCMHLSSVNHCVTAVPLPLWLNSSSQPMLGEAGAVCGRRRARGESAPASHGTVRGGRAWWVRGGRGGPGELVGRVGGGVGGKDKVGRSCLPNCWPRPSLFQPPGPRVAFEKRACLSSSKVGRQAEGRASRFCLLLPGSHGLASLGCSLSDGGYSITCLVWFSWGLD